MSSLARRPAGYPVKALPSPIPLRCVPACVPVHVESTTKTNDMFVCMCVYVCVCVCILQVGISCAGGGQFFRKVDKDTPKGPYGFDGWLNTDRSYLLATEDPKVRGDGGGGEAAGHRLRASKMAQGSSGPTGARCAIHDFQSTV